jgi:GT2 family glycosyltransferase
LDSISENVKGISFEVIVVDNNSSDESTDMVRDMFPWTKLIASPVNTYFAKGNNIGYKISDGDYIAFLNPDTVIYPNTFETAVAYLRKDSKVGAVTCKFLNPDGSFQREYYRRFPNLLTVFYCFTLFGAFIDKKCLKKKYENLYFYHDKRFEKIERIDQPSATFMVIPRTVLEKIGVFDEKFGIFFNDVDLCKRIWKADLEIHLLPSIAIIHYGGRGIGQLGEAAQKHFLEGCYRYFRKHHGIFYAFLVIILLQTHFLLVSAIANAKEHGIGQAHKKTGRFISKWIKNRIRRTS